MTKPASLVLCSLLLLTLGACTRLTSEQTSSAEVGELLVYTTLRQDEVDLYIEDFHIAYPDIQIEVERMSAATLIDRLLAERNEPQADLLWGVGLTSVLYLEWNDLLKPYAPVGLARVDERFRDTNQPPYWVGNSVAITAFCINSDEIARLGSTIPRSWQDLLDPSYRRAILLADPTKTESGLMASLGIFELFGEQEGWHYLDALHRNIAYYPQEETEPCELVDSGAYAIGIARTFDNLGKVQMVYPTEKSGWELSVSALLRKDPISPAARTFIDWSISDPVMRLYGRKNALTAAPIGLSMPAGYPTDPNAALVDLNIPWTAANRERLLTEWTNRYSDKVSELRTP